MNDKLLRFPERNFTLPKAEQWKIRNCVALSPGLTIDIVAGPTSWLGGNMTVPINLGGVSVSTRECLFDRKLLLTQGERRQYRIATDALLTQVIERLGHSNIIAVELCVSELMRCLKELRRQVQQQEACE